MKSKRLFWAISFLIFIPPLQAQKLFTPVDAGSKVHFVIRNFGIKTGGDFSGLKGTIQFDPKNAAASSFDVTVSSSSIDTDNDSRDGHLKKSDYFNVEKYPTIHMVSTKVQSTVKPGRYQFTGNLTIKATTKRIEFQFTVEEKNGGYQFTSDEISINRRAYDVGGNSISMADDLKLTLSVFAK